MNTTKWLALHLVKNPCRLMFEQSVDFLSIIPANGATVLGLLLLLGAIGLPLPTTLLVMASGAFVRQGIMEMDTALFALCCVVAGDSLSFAMGRLGHQQLERRLHANRGWQRAARSFQSNGGAAIYLTRWLFPSIAIPTNLLAGGSGYRYDRFLLITLFGEITWIVVFGGLGYALGSQWEIISGRLLELISLASTLVILSGCVYWCAQIIKIRSKNWVPRFSTWEPGRSRWINRRF